LKVSGSPTLPQRPSNGNIIPRSHPQWLFPTGYWEAKDSEDKLDEEIRNKISAGYPTSNIIFEDTREGVLYQNGREL
jgi:hypothetical protein